MGQRKCTCPVWVHGKVNGIFMRRSLGTRNFEAASRMILEWEKAGHASEGITVAECLDRFVRDCEARNLGMAAMGKYKLLRRELKAEFGDRPIGLVGADDLRGFREKWDLSPTTAQSKLERLRAFFRFCHESGWIPKNPASVLKSPRVKMQPTVPLEKEEIEKIMKAVGKYPDTPKGRREQVRAFLMLLRYSGLRIGDAVSLTPDKIKNGRLLLYSGKTSTPVHLPLPKEVLNLLQRISKNGRYFWTGNGTLKAAVSSWHRTLGLLFKRAGVKAHPHQFRHTLATELLSKGVPLEAVAAILGHSARICEKHYAPWVKSRQIALESEIRKAWRL